jgi:hypothetical protein
MSNIIHMQSEKSLAAGVLAAGFHGRITQVDSRKKSPARPSAVSRVAVDNVTAAGDKDIPGHQKLESAGSSAVNALWRAVDVMIVVFRQVGRQPLD